MSAQNVSEHLHQLMHVLHVDGGLHSELHPKLAYGLAFLSMVGVVTFIYASRGVLVVVRIVTYLASLAMVAISMKVVYTRHSFNYPKYVSFIHFVLTLLVALAIVGYRRLAEQKVIRVPAWRQFVRMIFPIAATFALSVGISNIALLYANVGFVEMIGCCTPICVVLVSTSLGQRFDSHLLMPVLVVCIGIALCASGELKYSVVGFVLSFTACLLRAVKTTLQGFLLDTPDFGLQNASVVLDPMELLVWTSVPSTAIMLAWSAATEGLEPYRWVLRPDAFPLCRDLGWSCVMACCVNVLGLYAMQDIGVLGSQITGQLKSILTVLGSVALLGETVKLEQVWGFACILAGVFWYNRLDTSLKAVRQLGSMKAFEDSHTADERTRLLPSVRSATIQDRRETAALFIAKAP